MVLGFRPAVEGRMNVKSIVPASIGNVHTEKKEPTGREGKKWEGACPKVKVGGRHKIMFCLAGDEAEVW